MKAYVSKFRLLYGEKKVASFTDANMEIHGVGIFSILFDVAFFGWVLYVFALENLVIMLLYISCLGSRF